ncbi:MAG: hypothetical protein LBQ73_05800 [Tannerellaceae bacterium]|jgi:hypothetical protein|nr:hypothetical protein [Tannerellaceae bacterium]
MTTREYFDEFARFLADEASYTEEERAERLLDKELSALDKMTNAEACKLYNVDYKAEAWQYIIDYYK